MENNVISFKERFLELKTKLVVGKGVENTYGGFNYRTKPQILEALKPLEKKYQIIISTTSELKEVGGRLFIMSAAIAKDVLSEESFLATAYAELQPKGGTKMSEPQLTGSSDSFAGKYALGNLLGIDDNQDPDSDELADHPQAQEVIAHRQEQKKQEVSQGNPQAKSLNNLKTTIFTLPSLTVEKANELYTQVKGLNDEPTINMLKLKAKQFGLDFNVETEQFVGGN